MAEKLTTVYHPTLEGITEDVPSANVSDWTDQGWLKSAPKNPTVPAEDAGTATAR